MKEKSVFFKGKKYMLQWYLIYGYTKSTQNYYICIKICTKYLHIEY